MLVYHDSCSKAGCHDGAPAWIAALLQRDVQMLGYRAPEFSRNTAEDLSPDGWKSLVEERKIEPSVSQDILLTRAGALTDTYTDTRAQHELLPLTW